MQTLTRQADRKMKRSKKGNRKGGQFGRICLRGKGNHLQPLKKEKKTGEREKLPAGRNQEGKSEKTTVDEASHEAHLKEEIFYSLEIVDHSRELQKEQRKRKKISEPSQKSHRTELKEFSSRIKRNLTPATWTGREEGTNK